VIQNSIPQQPQLPNVPVPPPQEIIENKPPPPDMLKKDRQSSFSVKLNNKQQRKHIDFEQPIEKKPRHDY